MNRQKHQQSIKNSSVYDPTNISQYDLICGDAKTTLSKFKAKSINCITTSPPYWGQREYDATNHIGLEADFNTYLKNLKDVFNEAQRVLKDDGSFWLNMGDRYVQKHLQGMPWRVALALIDDGWILRQDVIWDKMRLTQSARDRFRTIHEYVFHFVKKPKYYFNRKNILWTHDVRPKIVKGRIASITGVTGAKYQKEVRESKHLTKIEKKTALNDIERTLQEMKTGKIIDFRMQIRGRPRTFNGNSLKLSGRAKELHAKGYFIKTHKAEGHMPDNIFRLVPEDVHREDHHCAVYPVTLMDLPIRATCPPGGIVLDPFVGTGTSIVTALKHGKRAVGIDISKKYKKIAINRIKRYIEDGSEC